MLKRWWRDIGEVLKRLIQKTLILFCFSSNIAAKKTGRIPGMHVQCMKQPTFSQIRDPFPFKYFVLGTKGKFEEKNKENLCKVDFDYVDYHCDGDGSRGSGGVVVVRWLWWYSGSSDGGGGGGVVVLMVVV